MTANFLVVFFIYSYMVMIINFKIFEEIFQPKLNNINVNGNEIMMYKREIIYWGKTKQDVEIQLNANKYNL